MAGARSWSSTSFAEQEHAIHGASDPIDTPSLILTFEKDPMEENDATKPDYTPAKHLSNPVRSPDYSPAGLELFSSHYELDEDKEDTATSLEILPCCSTLSHRSFRSYWDSGETNPNKDCCSLSKETDIPTCITTAIEETMWMP
ncbi:unnamed protein product [Lactuca saligna]|uniref:Uncharacterized protein n=1 Tax=Lactuca saligna TaxID=75948 RepID=A0AA35ZAM4_LACSI|nr:unnamed protein product [Lactuca saligna]